MANTNKRQQDDQPEASEETPAGETATDAAQCGKPQSTWKAGLDLIAMLGGAIVVALLIKSYVSDVYIIPSGSMETALHGRPDGGDRIFCSKLSYRYRGPKRWEVAVFKFPYELARRTDRIGAVTPEMKNQNFVKRIVGMPGETLAIGRGDIWVRPEGSREEYKREVKPDSVQRGMWLKVYRQDFSDVDMTELRRFWKIMGSDAVIEKGGPLLLRPDSGGVRMDYRPMVPAGADKGYMAEMAGVPDRYVLEQPVQFRCGAKGSGGEACGHIFVKMLESHNVEARCPRCGSLADETEAVFYHRRSGIPAVGRYAVEPNAAPQGEMTSPRQEDYNIVPDLRVETDFTLSPSSSMAVSLREDARFVQIVAAAPGTVELRVNGRESQPGHRRTVALAPGGKHHLECYVVEGRVRVFLNGSAEPVLDEQIWDDKRPFPRNAPKASGVSLAAAGGEVRLHNIAIDRDVFYYSGREQDRGRYYSAMNDLGEVNVGPNSFFPMGDHCASSYDARSWGPVPLGMLEGPALLIWWPPERVRRIPSP